MIWESKYWKDDLLRSASFLKKKMMQHRWPESTKAIFEKNIMIGFYVIRKLLEAKKLSGKTSQYTFSAISYYCKDKNVNILNWHKVLELYDMDKGVKETLNLWYVANTIIHSFVFIGVFGENDYIEAVMFNSDRSKNNKLYSIDLNDIIKIFEVAGNDYPEHIEYKLNIHTKEYEVTT